MGGKAFAVATKTLPGIASIKAQTITPLIKTDNVIFDFISPSSPFLG
jgi:hypothetical protein